MIFRTSHTFAVMGRVTTNVPTPAFFIAEESATQTTTSVKVRYKIATGTSLTFKVQKNGVDWIGTTAQPLTATTTTAETFKIDALADNDEIDLVVLEANNDPQDLSVTLVLQHELIRIGTSMTPYLQARLAEESVGTSDYEAPEETYLGLFTVTPTDVSYGTELAGLGYVRRIIAWGDASQIDGTMANTSQLLFGPATGPWGILTGIAIFDAEEGGNMLYYGSITNPQNIAEGDIYELAPESVTIILD